MSMTEHMTHRLYLKPGQVCVATRPTFISTVLGSCISATFFHPISGSAAICHAVQPVCRHYPDCSDQCVEKYKYVSCVIPEMIRILCSKGIRPSDLELKLFGGADVLIKKRPSGEMRTVGQMNIETAMETISTRGLKLKEADIGGVSGRKIVFDTKTGKVLIRHLKRTD